MEVISHTHNQIIKYQLHLNSQSLRSHEHKPFPVNFSLQQVFNALKRMEEKFWNGKKSVIPI